MFKALKALIKDKKRIISFFVLIISVLATVWTVKAIGVDSAWNWSLKQDTFWNAVIELLVVFLVLAVSLCAPRSNRVRLVCVALTVGLFSYLHAVFYVLIAMCLYAAFIWLTGRLLCKFILKDMQNDPMACVLLGLMSIILLVGLCSAVKLGTPDKLGLIYIILFITEAVIFRKEIKDKIQSFFNSSEENFRERVFCGWIYAGTITAVLIQLGRSAIALDYDSMWYGLRSDVMVAPFTGIYDEVLATGVVYSYPKGIEALALVFSTPITYTFVYGVNIMLSAMMLYAAYRIMRLFCQKKTALLVSLLCSVTPGIMNMSVTAKSDIVTLLVQLMMIYFIIKAINEKSGSSMLLSLGAAVFSFCFKPSAMVFTSILIAPAIVIFIIKKIRIKASQLLILILPIAANLVLMVRTWLLTGMPITQFGDGVLRALGFSYKLPYAQFEATMTSVTDFFLKGVIWQRLPRIFDFLFAPTDSVMDHVVIAWGGVLFAVCWLVLVAYVLLRPRKTFKKICENGGYAYSLIATVLISGASMGSMLLLQKPDGNYFSLMYAMTFIHLFIELRDMPEDTLGVCCKKVVPLVISGAMLCLLTSWSWTLGLTPVNSKYNKNGYYDHMEQNRDKYETIGVSDIAQKLGDEGGRNRVIILSGEGPWLLSIPAIAEDWLDVSHWGNKALSHTDDGLFVYFKYTKTDYVLIERSFIESDGMKQTAENMLELAERGSLSINMERDKYILLNFNEACDQNDEALIAYFEGIINNENQ